MKTFALIAAAAMAVSTANAAECVLTEIAVDFLDIVEDVYTCAEVTGYAIVPPTTNPTTQQAADICTKCAKLVTEAKTKTFPTCTFNIDGVDTPLNEFFQKVVGSCGSSSTSTGSSAGSKAVSSTTIEAPAATTAAPAASTSTPTSSGSGSSTSTTVSSSTPTPSTTTSAGVVASVSAAVVAVASVAAYAL